MRLEKTGGRDPYDLTNGQKESKWRKEKGDSIKPASSQRIALPRLRLRLRDGEKNSMNEMVRKS